MQVVGRRLAGVDNGGPELKAKPLRNALPPCIAEYRSDICPQLALRSVFRTTPQFDGGPNKPTGYEHQQESKSTNEKTFVVVHENAQSGRRTKERTSEWLAYGGIVLLFTPILALFLSRRIWVAWLCVALFMLLVGAIGGLE